METSSDRGQIILETLLVFFFLTAFFLFTIATAEKNKRPHFEKHQGDFHVQVH
jgi:hypothetical protein